MTEWTTGQEELLRANAHKGAEFCAQIIAEEYGIRRSPAATLRKMNRLGITSMRYEICPMCGRRVLQLVRGRDVCKMCNAKARLQRERERAAMQLEWTDEDEREFQRIERERKALQRRNERLAHGKDTEA